MESTAVRANCFDASALVKVYSSEEGSEILKKYFNSEATKYTTPFCFYEALGVLKVKWLYRKEITKDEYQKAAFKLTAWYGASNRRINDINFGAPEIIKMAHELVEKTSLDLTDVFQIISVKEGYFSKMSGESKTILVTGDKCLADSARGEGVRVWYYKEPQP